LQLATSTHRHTPQLLRAEIAIMKLVNHPNIIRMEAVYESRQHIFIVMELHSGGELFDRVNGRPRLTEDEAFCVVYPLLESVAYLHEMGIVHRDLKVRDALYLLKVRVPMYEHKCRGPFALSIRCCSRWPICMRWASCTALSRYVALRTIAVRQTSRDHVQQFEAFCFVGPLLDWVAYLPKRASCTAIAKSVMPSLHHHMCAYLRICTRSRSAYRGTLRCLPVRSALARTRTLSHALTPPRH
jgi:Protein kinase domain